jgi:hypothetical protein
MKESAAAMNTPERATTCLCPFDTSEQTAKSIAVFDSLARQIASFPSNWRTATSSPAMETNHVKHSP